MVYIHFPNHHTDEEITLQAKYQKLKRKKKSLQAQKTPRPEPERAQASIAKRPIEAKDAREVARKLLKSGAINPIVRTPKRCEQKGFKRPRGLERTLTETDRTVSGYQPFSAVQDDNDNNTIVETTKPKFKSELYENFVSAKREHHAEEKTNQIEKKSTPYNSDLIARLMPPADKPKMGNTVFVQGAGISEEFLRLHFSVFGKICSVSMELEKGRGFITFDSTESADKAITEMNGSYVKQIKLKVSFARRQIKVQPINDATSSTTWSALACSHSQKGNHKDKRDQVVYDDDFSFFGSETETPVPEMTEEV